jgi:hypothetical protein
VVFPNGHSSVLLHTCFSLCDKAFSHPAVILFLLLTFLAFSFEFPLFCLDS